MPLKADKVHLKLLRDAGLAVAADVATDKKNPLSGFCAAMVTVVQACMGGDIVTGKFKGENHYWNRLPSGEEVDLTSCQFGGDGYKPLKKGRKVRKPELVDPRFLLFADRMLRKLQKGSL